MLTLLACGIDLPVKPVHEDRVVLALDSIDAGDGGTVSEFIADQLTKPLEVDWSFANLPGLEERKHDRRSRSTPPAYLRAPPMRNPLPPPSFRGQICVVGPGSRTPPSRSRAQRPPVLARPSRSR